jgi:hypothetical protein
MRETRRDGAGSQAKGLNHALTGILRGSSSMADAIVAFHRALASYPFELIDDNFSINAERFFHIDPDNFGASLPLELKHLRQVEGLTKVKSAKIEANYLLITTEYILANQDRVNTLIQFDRTATLESFECGAENIRDSLISLPAVDRQSITILKLFAAIHAYSDELTREFFEQNMHSAWTKSALIYPMMYYFGNLPNEASIDKMLFHFVPKVGLYKTERSLMKFFLSPQEDWFGNLSLRCYLGLLSHPYDALDYIVSGLEIAISKGELISSWAMSSYRRLSAAFPQHRLNMWIAIAERRPITETNQNFLLERAEARLRTH